MGKWMEGVEGHHFRLQKELSHGNVRYSIGIIVNGTVTMPSGDKW